ncbi:helix-turn-helix domain-containing protein [Sphingobium lactosutens]|uniref:helix-turn-helix domain-containing protein n=1 Tax=Sphingobium lactosutens TaxID=522773 RepID=UPI0015BE6B63|nr:AraC family transcriptional regulator [Sphingobium lactosutens]
MARFDTGIYSARQVSDQIRIVKRDAVHPSGPASLSEILLQDLRVERAHAQILMIRQDAKWRMPAIQLPVLYTVLEGDIRLEMAYQPSINLIAGDNVLIFYGDAHLLGKGPLTVAGMAPSVHNPMPELVERRRVGQGSDQAVVLQSVLELTYVRKNAHVSRAAPDLLVLHAPTDANREAPFKSFSYSAKQLAHDLEGPGSLALVSAFANMQLCHALKQWSSRLWGESVHDVRCPNMRRVATVVREIRAHPDRPWCVTDLARHVGLSRSAFAAAFHEIVGEAPIAFLTRTRMERAATLLRTDSLSMYEVAQRVGYPIESSFARAFKRHWGVPPRSFSDKAEGEAAATGR